MFSKILFALICIISSASISKASIGGYIGDAEKAKFLEIATAALKADPNDLVTTYYGVKTFTILRKPIEKTLKTESCSNIKKSFKPSGSIDIIFNALNAWKLLQCDGKIHTEELIKSLRTVLENDKSTASDIYYAIEALASIGQPVPNPTKTAQNLQAVLKKDNNLQNLGYSLHAAALLGNSGKFINDWVEDIIVQADEVDGKLLQWEGGLTSTSLILTGLLRLPSANPLTQEQVDKFASYLLTRRTVQTPKGVVALLEAASALAASKVSPVSISVIGPPYVSLDKPDLKVKVSDIFGAPLKSSPGPVVAQTISKVSDNSVVLTKQPLAAGTKPTEFVLTLKLEPGYYKVSLSVGSNTAAFNVRVLGPASIKSFEIGVTDSDGISISKLTKLSYPGKLPSKLDADAGHHLVVKFSVSRIVHQAFVRLYSGPKEIIFVAELDNNKNYKISVNLAQELTTGLFNIELILGDSIMTNPIRWEVGSIDVKLGAPPVQQSKVVKGPKPEISHLFRQPDKRPSQSVSLFFTALTAAPFLLLLILWAKIGINCKNFTVVAVPFHLGVGAILCLFTLFWLKLDMFTTCYWLIPIGSFTFLSGHRLLSHIAGSKKADK